MTTEANYEQEKARRFRDDALLHLDDVFALARYLMRNAEDAEDAVQECYLRALRHFDSYHGPAMKPWLLAIVRNVCNARFARLKKQEISTDFSEGDSRPEQIPNRQNRRGAGGNGNVAARARAFDAALGMERRGGRDTGSAGLGRLS
jgi:DNA-directed RNA polymerase specialized sigma24 family protein